MGQILFTDRTGALSYSNPNVAMAASVSSPAYLTIGGSQFTVTAQLSANTGSLTLQNLYHIYAVQTAGVVSLVVSTNVNSIGPAGFNSWKLIGAFYTDTSAVFNAFVSNKSQTVTTVTSLLAGSGTYTTPKQAISLKVRLVGGGGGGANSGTASSTDGSAGGNTTFGSSLLTANGGSGGLSNARGGAGGTVTLSSPAIGTAFAGGRGSGSLYTGTTVGQQFMGGQGAATPFGGAGAGVNQGAGTAAEANTGSGGGGAGIAGASLAYCGGGGGAGGFIDAIITSPSATYAYAIGASGAGATAGTNGNAGGAGAAGVIVIEENKPNLEQLKDL